MSAEAELYAALSGFSGLAALVGARIYPDAVPEGNALPAVVYQRLETELTTTISGAVVAEDVKFSIAAWAETRAAADASADQIALALAAAGNPATDRSAEYDAEIGAYACTTACQWWRSIWA